MRHAETKNLAHESPPCWDNAVFRDAAHWRAILLLRQTTGTLSNMPAVLLLPLSGLPVGIYDLYFGYDKLIDGQADLSTMNYHGTTLRVVFPCRYGRHF